MMKNRLPIALVSAVVLAAPALAETPPSVPAIERAHRMADYVEAGGVTAGFNVNFGGGPLIGGTMQFTPSLSHVRMDLDDGGVVIYRDGDVFVSPADYTTKGYDARFHVLTWPYFMALPFKLSDPGVNVLPGGDLPINDADDTEPSLQVTFGDGVGDAPDDWYYLFTSDDAQLTAAAYIVTYNTDAAEAAQKPSIIRYGDYELVDGVPFSTRWTFNFWNKQTGIDGEPKGEAEIDGIELGPIDAARFTPPVGARKL